MAILHAILGKVMGTPIKFFSKRREPRKTGSYILTGLKEEVEIIRDDNGIPYISAKNEEDLYFAQGFTHAQDRFWQMELVRRTSNGTLSELFGDLALDTDRASRTIGFRRLGIKDRDHTPKEVIVALESYAAGINAWLNHPEFKLPIEFTLIKQKPIEWQVEDSLAFSRLMMWQLSHDWYSELIRAQLIDLVGEDLAAQLEVDYPEKNPSILPKGIEFNKINLDGVLEKLNGPFLSRNAGSNSIGISGKLTETGKPILANDVHLALSTPGLWVQNLLEIGDKYVMGVVPPGLPMVLIGQNNKIAWGVTLAYTDSADVYLEKFNFEDATYEYKGKMEKAIVLEEKIYSKDRKEPLIEKIYQTVHGTIFSNIIDEDLSDDYAIAVKDMALEKSRALAGWYNLGKAENWDDFVDCMRLIDTPQLNIAYSDLEDNIGYWCTGKIPIRKEGNGKVPVPGWTGEHDWDGVIPFEEMPHLLNPEQGYIITTNNRIVDSDFPHYLGEIWMNGYRARRLEDLILETIKERKITQKDLNDFMMDDYCIPGVEFQAHFMDLDLSDFNDREAKILEIFATWDGRMDTESVGASLYEVSKYFTFKQIFETKLGKKLTENMMGIGFHPVLLSANVFFGRDTVALLRLLNTNSEWLEDSKENILKASFKLAIEWLEDNLGKGYSNWKWGSIHQASFPHAFDITPPMDRIFNVKPIPIRGNTDTPFQTAMNADDVFNNNAWSPSYRVSFDLRDLTKTEGIICPGQSGTLGSKHYDDLVERWSNGELLHYYIDPKDRRDKFDAKLILSPK